MDGPSDNLRSSTAVNMHQRKWKRSVDYIGNWMVSKCPHDMMVKRGGVDDVEDRDDDVGDDDDDGLIAEGERNGEVL